MYRGKDMGYTDPYKIYIMHVHVCNFEMFTAKAIVIIMQDTICIVFNLLSFEYML